MTSILSCLSYLLLIQDGSNVDLDEMYRETYLSDQTITQTVISLKT